MSNIPKLRFPEFKGEWEEKRIQDFAECCAGATPDTKKDEYWIDGTIPWMSSGEVNNTFIYSTEKKITQLGYDKTSTKLLPSNTVVIALAGQGKTRGTVAITRIELCTNQSLCAVLPDINLNSEYLFYFLSSQYKQLRNSSTGGDDSRGGLNLKIIGNFRLPYTTLAEQQKIADFLSNVDSIITAETKILNTLQKKKKALMQKLFTRQLRFKSDDGTDFPAWEEKKLGEISSSPKYGLNASGIDYDGEHKYLRITDIDEVTHTFSPEEITTPSEFSDDYLLEENDIVFARTGASTGKTYLYNPNDGDLYFAGFLIKFHIKDANARFVFYQTCTHEYEKWVHVMSTRSGQPGINSEEYSTLKIKLPCIEEQQKIADCLSSLDSLIQTQQKVVTTWQQRKKALLQQMFI